MVVRSCSRASVSICNPAFPFSHVFSLDATSRTCRLCCLCPFVEPLAGILGPQFRQFVFLWFVPCYCFVLPDCLYEWIRVFRWCDVLSTHKNHIWSWIPSDLFRHPVLSGMSMYVSSRLASSVHNHCLGCHSVHLFEFCLRPFNYASGICGSRFRVIISNSNNFYYQ